MKRISILLLLLGWAIGSTAQNITGSWFGSLELPGTKLRLVFHIQEKDGKYQTTLDSPDQGAKGIPTSTTIFENSRLSISLPALNAKYEGVFSNDKIKGTFTQGQSFPLDLSRKDNKPERPQEPQAPYPYYTEEVRFENKQDNLTLAGTLSLPQKTGKYPAVILITGSGPQNRDEELAGHKPFKVIADHLTRQGIAVLRFDDRGTAGSTGNFTNGTSADFARDVEAAIDYLKTRKEIQTSKIGLIGHSEGGMIAPVLASQRKDISFIVLLAAPGIRCQDLWLKQIGDIANVKDEAKHKALVEAYRGISEILFANPQGTTLKPLLEKYLQTHISEIIAQEPITPEQEKQLIAGMANTFSMPWLQHFITYNPEPYLEKTKCPVLALNGGKDIQVNAEQNLAGIHKALTKAGNRSFKTIQLEGLNHLFQECNTGHINEYATITQTFSPKALQIMSEWIKEQTKK